MSDEHDTYDDAETSLQESRRIVREALEQLRHGGTLNEPHTVVQWHAVMEVRDQEGDRFLVDFGGDALDEAASIWNSVGMLELVASLLKRRFE